MKSQTFNVTDGESELDGKPKKHATTYLETIIHFVKAGIGAGIFAMAEAMSFTGIILGSCLTIFLSAVCLYEQHVLLKCASNVRKHYDIKDRRPDYGETFQLALLANDRWKKHAKLMKIISNLFLILTQLGFCAVYFVFIGNTMSRVLTFFGYEFGVRVIIGFALIPILITSLINNLKFLGILSFK
jgi:solute carrier family 36 (proton-coupled amino acid transporter)